jgi:cell wall-associated NlpC family hydrolase
MPDLLRRLGSLLRIRAARLRGRRRSLALALVAVAGLAALAQLAGGEDRAPSRPAVARAGSDLPDDPADPKPRPRPRAVEITGVGADPGTGGEVDDGARSARAQSDAEIRAEIGAFRQYLLSPESTGALQVGPRARVLPDGTAVAPRNAPRVVKLVIKAGNAIARSPYRWGGGHAGWTDTGYDCSGSVSYALAGAGLLRRPLASGGFVRWGAPGDGRWITIYTNPGHMFMMVAGLRFDTSGRGDRGTRWQEAPRSTAGFVARHYPGL